MGAEVPAAAIEQQLEQLEFMEPKAAIAKYLPVECEAIVSHPRTFVNESNTTTYTSDFPIFCAQHTKVLLSVHNLGTG